MTTPLVKNISALLNGSFKKEMDELTEHMKKAHSAAVNMTAATMDDFTTTLLSKENADKVTAALDEYANGAHIDIEIGEINFKVQPNALVPEGKLLIMNPEALDVNYAGMQPPYDEAELEAHFKAVGAELDQIIFDKDIASQTYIISLRGYSPSKAHGDFFGLQYKIPHEFPSNQHSINKEHVHEVIMSRVEERTTRVPQNVFLKHRVEGYTQAQRLQVAKIRADWAEEQVHFEQDVISKLDAKYPANFFSQPHEPCFGWNWTPKLKFYGLRGEWEHVEVWNYKWLYQIRGILSMPKVSQWQGASRRVIYEFVHPEDPMVDEFNNLVVYLLNERAVDLIRTYALRTGDKQDGKEASG